VEPAQLTKALEIVLAYLENKIKMTTYATV
jgi:hypothetical protein